MADNVEINGRNYDDHGEYLGDEIELAEVIIPRMSDSELSRFHAPTVYTSYAQVKEEDRRYYADLEIRGTCCGESPVQDEEAADTVLKEETDRRERIFAEIDRMKPLSGALPFPEHSVISLPAANIQRGDFLREQLYPEGFGDDYMGVTGIELVERDDAGLVIGVYAQKTNTDGEIEMYEYEPEEIVKIVRC